MDIISSCKIVKNPYWILISGVQEQDELLSLRRKIELLGGRVEDLARNIFTPVCTHVIAKEFSSTEKVLGALAGGKWLLRPEYIKDSFERGHWLNETKYELTNHRSVARYCRQSKENRGNGIYSGWTIYIKLENVNMTRSFRRVVAAGGAEIASVADISKADVAISDREMLTSVRSLVGSVTPIVGISYIKDTLILKADPSQLLYHLLDASMKKKLSRKLVFDNAGTPLRINNGWSLQKRPLTEVPININKSCARSENLSPPSYQQTKMDHLMKLSPSKVMPVSSKVCQASAKNLKRKYQRIPFSTEKYSPITKYFATEPKPFGQSRSPLIESLPDIKTMGMKRDKEQIAEQIGNMSIGRIDDEIEVVEEIPRTCSAKSKVNEIRILDSDSDDCLITKVVGNFGNELRKMYHPQNIFSEKDREHFRKEIRRRIDENKKAKLKVENQQCGTVDNNEVIVLESVNFDQLDLGEGKNSRTIEAHQSNLIEEKDSRTTEISQSNFVKGKDSGAAKKYLSNLGEGDDSRTTDICSIELVERRDSKTTEKYQSISEGKDSKTTELNFGKGEVVFKDCFEKEEDSTNAQTYPKSSSYASPKPRIAETYLKSSSYSSPKPNNPKSSSYSSPNPKPNRLNLIKKEARVDIGPRVDELLGMKSKQQLTHGRGANTRQTPLVKRSSDPSVFKLVLSKEDLKKGIVQFVRKSKAANRIYCCDVAQCLTGVLGDMQCVNSVDNSEDFDSDQILYSPSHTHYSTEIRELTVEETSYYESSIDQDTIGMHIMTSKEQEIIVQGLDSLYLYITPYVYPHVELFGDLLRKLILETQFSIVHSRALGLAYRVLAFHPPVNSYMRTYYLRVLKSAIQNEELGCNQAWKFVRSVIETLQMNADLESDGSSSGSGVEDDTSKRENALRLLQFFIVLFREDIRLCTNWEAVTEFLTWRVFWGQSRNPSVLTTPVKQLLNLWVSMQSASSVIRQCLAQLVSLMLELAWRCDNHSLTPVGPLPDSLIAIDNELRLRMKDCGPHSYIQLILDLPSPWPRMVICSLIFQELAEIQCPHITLGNIIDYGQAVCASQNTKIASKSKPFDKDLHQNKRSLLFKCTPPVRRPIAPRGINKKNFKGETPLIRSCMKNDLKQVRELIAVPGIDINLSDNYGWTALHEAAIRGFDECVKILLSYNYDSHGIKNYYSHTVDTSAKGGEDERTPLHDAVESNHLSTVKLLLECGGDSLLKDETKYGKTALDLATTKEMRQLLKSYTGTPPAVVYHRGDYSQKYSKPSVINSGRRSPNGILPCREDQMTFVLIYVNSYLEVSGTRFLQFATKEEIRQVHMHHRAKVKHPNIVEAGVLPSVKHYNNNNTNEIKFKVEDKDDRVTSNRTEETEVKDTDNRIICDRTDNSKISGEKSKRLFYQNLSGEVTTPTTFEKSLSDRLYEHLRNDLMTCRDQKNGKPLHGDKTEFLEAIQYLFF